jgi:GDP-D-mannose 3',5'-epimerase
MSTAIVFGAGGFIGSHLVEALRASGRNVYGVDRHLPRFGETHTAEFFLRDLRSNLTDLPPADEVYQMCAFLGGAGIIDGKAYDGEIFMNNMSVNLSVLEYCKHHKVPRIFFPSSACVYAEGSTRLDPVNAYGWEKLAAEQLYAAFGRQYGAEIRIGRLFNIYGPNQEFQGGRERVVSALCRKVYEAKTSLPILGNGKPLRTFLYVTDCTRAIQTVMESSCSTPVNIGSSRLLSIADLARIVANHAGKSLVHEYTDASDRQNVRACDTQDLVSLGWSESVGLEEGVARTYDWVAKSCATIS